MNKNKFNFPFILTMLMTLVVSHAFCFYPVNALAENPPSEISDTGPVENIPLIGGEEGLSSDVPETPGTSYPGGETSPRLVDEEPPLPSKAPEGWFQDNWGDNAAVFSYTDDGFEGGTSFYVGITDYSDGDAKWSSNPKTVAPDTNYVFANYYKATETTYMIGRYVDAEGNVFYVDHGWVPPAEEWTRNQLLFKTPNNAVKMAMLHLIASKGELWTADYSIEKDKVDPLPLPPVSEEAPEGWFHDNWGSNTAVFSYDRDGFNGNIAFRVQMKSHTHGDAKWSSNPVSVLPGANYLFSNYYQATETTYMVGRYYDEAGNVFYVNYGWVEPAEEWTRNQVFFQTPDNAVKMTMLHLIASRGELWTANYSLDKDGNMPPLTPLGSTFEEISAGMIALLVKKHNTSGSYGRTWGDYSYTDIGLDPAHWKSPVLHMYFRPSGANLLISPEKGYKFTAENEQGEKKTIGFGHNLIYSDVSKKWYYHSILPANVIDITTLKVEDSSSGEFPPPPENIPEGWFQDNWGNNTAAFAYTDGGNGGINSFHVHMIEYTDGDAKWSAQPISIVPDANYVFANNYKATDTTYLIGRYFDAEGKVFYVDHGWAPKTVEWMPNKVFFKTPANAVKMAMLHLLASKGELWTDSYSIEKDEIAPPPPPPADAPEGWFQDNWGRNTAVFAYADGGREGNKSFFVDMRAYTDGDTKWSYQPVSVSPGTNYVFTNYYKATDITYMVGRYLDEEGNQFYVNHGWVDPSEQWTLNKVLFKTPDHAVSMAMLHVIASKGQLWTDSYSLEKADITSPLPQPEAPAGWHRENWGKNTAVFAYADEGYDGNKSLYIHMKDYTNGDAKWAQEPVSVTPAADYVFTNFYKSNTRTYLVGRYYDGSGNIFHIHHGWVEPAEEWTRNQVFFKTPVTAVRMTMLHLIASKGELWTEDHSIEPEEEPVPGETGIPNSSLEVASASHPKGWKHSSWGTHHAEFEYLTTGYAGKRSVKVTVSNYADGDAKWYYDPIVVNPGGYYQFSDYYQSDIATRVRVMVIKKDGSTEYLRLHNAPSSPSWKKYTAAFRMPEDAVRASVIHCVATNGYLITDDYSLVPANPSFFKRPLLSLTFDDGWEINYETALPLMEKYGFKSTQFYATTFIVGSGLESRIKAFMQRGHEIGSHTVSHPDMTTLTEEELDYELGDSKEYLETLTGKGKITAFASPYGLYDDKSLTFKQKYYASHRSVDEGYNSRDDFHPYNVKVMNILDTTTAAEVKAWVKQAQDTNTWLVLVYHKVTDTPGRYDTSIQNFEQQLEVIKASGIDVLTYTDALNEIYPQLAK